MQSIDCVGPTAITEPFFNVQVTFILKSLQEEQTAILRRYSSRPLAAGSGMTDHQLPNSPDWDLVPQVPFAGVEYARCTCTSSVATISEAFDMVPVHWPDTKREILSGSLGQSLRNFAKSAASRMVPRVLNFALTEGDTSPTPAEVQGWRVKPFAARSQPR